MKKIFATVLALTLIFALVPFSAFNVSAGNGVQAKIDQLLAVYPTGSYFTTTGKAHYMLDSSICPSNCGVCQLKNQNPNKLGGLPAGNEVGLSGWQCWAFASYAFYHIFGNYGLRFSDCSTVNLSNAKLGDIVSFTLSGYPHYGVYLYTSGSKVVVYDANYDYYCGVRYGSSYSVSAVNAVYRAPNYDAVNGSTPTPTPDPVYENIAEDTYVVKNNNTGTYMCVSYGADANLQNVDMYNEINAASKMVITKASTGYKIRPECCASRLVNPYGYSVTSGLNVNIYNDENDSTQWWQFQKVSGGYVIRNVQNPDCVLDTDGGNVFVSSYTGASTQIWSLISTHVHSYGSWKVKSSATCTSNGTEYRTCSCGAEETRTISALGHNYTSATTKPTCTSGGYTTYTCSRCSHSYTGNSTSAKGHTPGSAATCTSAQTCTTCGVVLANAKGHTPGASATCTSPQTCTTCGVVLANAKGHTPGASATCTSPQTCTTCGVVLANAKGHTLGAAATCTSPQTCTTCGVVLANAKGHTPGAAATCTTAQTCTTCGETLKAATGHTAGASATCTSAQTCTTCGEVLATATGHTPGAPADCYNEQICTSCGVVLNATTEHDYVITISEPTCTTDGYATKSCSICGECFYSVIEAPGHTEGEWETLPDGSKELHCDICGELLDSEAVPLYKDGDVNGDGKVNMFDYAAVKSHVLGKAILDDEKKERADTNGDGKINMFDYIKLKALVLIG